MTNDEMDDMVDAWHDGEGNETIWEFMGMTQTEYASWVETCVIPQSYLDRRSEIM